MRILSSVRICAIRLIVFLLSVSSSAIATQVGFEVTTSINGNQNLYSDSTETYDLYSMTSLKFKVYPLSNLEVGFTGEQSYYRDGTGLSNAMGGITAAYVPMKGSSPLQLYLSGSLNGRIYHRDFSRFDNNFGDITISAGYRVSSHSSVRSGFSYRATRYVKGGIVYKRDIDIYGGVNATLPYSNSLDLEAGFARTNFVHKDNVYFRDSIPPGYNFPWDYRDWFIEWIGDTESQLWVFHYSPRLSRPIGSRTGIAITYSQRLFQNYSRELIYGLTTGFLSPWASAWEGNTVSISIKTFLIPRCIVTAGAGYWDKAYIYVIENYNPSLFYVDARDLKKNPRREDWQTRLYMSIQIPMKGPWGFLMEPSINADYFKNVSNRSLYYYSGFSVAAGVRFRI